MEDCMPGEMSMWGAFYISDWNGFDIRDRDPSLASCGSRLG